MNGVFDNSKTMCREIYRDGELVAWCSYVLICSLSNDVSHHYPSWACSPWCSFKDVP